MKSQFNIEKMVSIIAVVSDNRGLGLNNKLLWHIPEDLKRFKNLTTGKNIIMGKKTWESLPRKPLPGRRNIVLTDVQDEIIECSVTAYSIEDALAKCDEGAEIFVIGGGSVYRQFLPYADRLYLTHVHQKVTADVFFPKIDRRVWKVVEKEDFKSESLGETSCTYAIYERKRKIGRATD